MGVGVPASTSTHCLLILAANHVDSRRRSFDA
jgi:hypothetical protein